MWGRKIKEVKEESEDRLFENFLHTHTTHYCVAVSLCSACGIED
jgi:hypothetical protein